MSDSSFHDQEDTAPPVAFSFARPPSWREQQAKRSAPQDASPQPRPNIFAHMRRAESTSSSRHSVHPSPQTPTILANSTPQSSNHTPDFLQDADSPTPSSFRFQPAQKISSTSKSLKLSRRTPAPSDSSSRAHRASLTSTPPSGLQERLLLRKRKSVEPGHGTASPDSLLGLNAETNSSASRPVNFSTASLEPNRPSEARVDTPPDSVLHLQVLTGDRISAFVPVPEKDSSAVPDDDRKTTSQADTTARDRSTSRAPPDGFGRMSMAFEAMRAMEEENARLKLEVDRLTARTAILEDESSTLAAKHKRLQAKSSEMVEKANDRLASLKGEIDELKTQTTVTSALMRDIVSTRSEMADIRSSVQSTLSDVKPLIEDTSDVFSKATSSRHLLDDIRQDTESLVAEKDRKQHVIDMLREELEACTGHLHESRDRVTLLESEQDKSRRAVETISGDLAAASVRIKDLAIELRNQQVETVMALAQRQELQALQEKLREEHADMSQKLADADSRVTVFQVDLATALEAKEQLSQQLAQEICKGSDLQLRLDALSRVEASLEGKEAVIEELREQLQKMGDIENAQAQKEQALRDLNDQLHQSRINEATLQTQAKDLQDTLDERSTAQATLTQQVADLTTANRELEGIAGQVKVLNEQLTETKAMLEVEKEHRYRATLQVETFEKKVKGLTQDLTVIEGKLQRSNTRCEVLEQRRADQEEASQTQIQDLQARLDDAGKKAVAVAKELSAASNQVAASTASLSEQRSNNDRLQSEMTQLRKSLEYHSSEGAKKDTMLKQLQGEVDRTNKAIDSLSVKYNAAEERNQKSAEEVAVLKKELEEAEKREDDLQLKVADLETEIADTTPAPVATQEDSQSRQLAQQVDDLTDRLDASERKYAARETSLKNIVARFHAGEQLPEIDGNIIRDSMNMARKMYEKELVMQANDNKGSRTMISNLNTRIEQLEVLLAKEREATKDALKPPEPVTVAQDVREPPQSSPMSDPPAPDADVVTTDSTPSSPPRPLPPRQPPVQYSSQHTLISRQNFAPRNTAAASRRAFAELNQETTSEDPILEFDDSPDSAKSASASEPTTNGSKEVSGSVVARKGKRKHDEEDEIEDEENAPKPSAKGKASKPAATRRQSNQAQKDKVAATAAAPKPKAKKRR